MATKIGEGWGQLDGYKQLSVCNILDGFYFINEYGEIISNKSGKKLHPKIDRDGYLCVALCTNEVTRGKEHKRKMFRIAGLVLREFKGDPPAAMVDPTVDHADGMKKNNHVSNLRWMERSTNSAIRKNQPIGEKNGAAILTEKEVSEIKWLLENTTLSLRLIGERYGVHKSTISNIKRKKCWVGVPTNSTGRR